MLKRVDSKGKGIKCAICNTTNELLSAHTKVCLNCYFKHDQKIPKYIPFEQHDSWIISNHKKEQRNGVQ